MTRCFALVVLVTACAARQSQPHDLVPDTSASIEAQLSTPDPLEHALARAAHEQAPDTSPLSDTHMATMAQGQQLVVPTIVPQGTCVRVIGVTTAGNVLHMAALDRDGQVLAQSLGDSEVAVVGTAREFLCAPATHPQTLRLEITMVAGDGRIAVRTFGRPLPPNSDVGILGLLFLLAL